MTLVIPENQSIASLLLSFVYKRFYGVPPFFNFMMAQKSPTISGEAEFYAFDQ